MNKQRIRHLIYLVVLVIIDQLTKYWAKTTLIDSSITIIPKVLKLEYSTNTGAAWGIFGDHTEFLIIFTIIVFLALVYFYTKIPFGKKYNALHVIWVFILAGGIGNLIDRIVNRYVVDFIYFEIIDFPNFNVADSYLTVSCVLLLILALFYYKEEDLEFINKIFSRKAKNKAATHDGNEIQEANDNANK